MARRATIKIVERRLGGHKALGLYWYQQNSDGSRDKRFTPIIEIDPRQAPKEELDTVLHESLHHVCPELTEEQVVAAAADMTQILWGIGYRRVKL